MKTLDLANEIELVVLAFFQERIGFQNWWDSLAPHIQENIEDLLIEEIFQHLNKPVEPTAKAVPICPLCGYSEHPGINCSDYQ